MKQFLKLTLASVVGVIIALSIFSIIIIIAIGLVTNSETQYKLSGKSLLKISIDGTLKEQSIENPFDLSIPGLPIDTKTKNQGLDDILSAISKAKDNSKINGIYLDVKTLNAGFGSIEEIRNALIDFKKSGKFIIAYGDRYDQREYYICSVADKIFINPVGMMNFCGLSAQPVFFKGTLDKLGVKAEVFKVGTFKSAVEPYINTKMSDANRLQTQEYLSGIWNNLLKNISTSRNISVNTLKTLANRNMLFQPIEELVKNKLIDSLAYKSGVMEYLAKRLDLDKTDDLKFVSITQMLTVPDKKVEYIKDKIAILYAEGEIFDSGSDGIVSDNIVSEIVKIKNDKSVKAVVFRVNSPGGSAFGSEQIWKAITDLKTEKPVVVSMGDYAASGGYYISCNANKIIASPNTLTGSIGIFGTFFVIDELTKKLGLSFDVVKTNDLSDLGNMTRPMTEIEKHTIQGYIERSYNLFVKRCSEGRKIKNEDLRKIAEGRVWTGEKAVKIGLADEVGGINRAIEVAAQLCKIKKYRIVSFPEKKNVLTEFLKEFQSETKIRIASSYLGEEYAPLLKLKESKIQSGILARMDEIDIH